MQLDAIKDFLRYEASGGILLIAAAALGLIMANSGLGGMYTTFLEIPVSAQVGALVIAKPLILWINDGLMAVFFFLVGLEIKREIMDGELSKPSQIVLPTMAAIGGMVGPALVFVYFNHGNPAQMNGWAIPTATDIAFALGVLALLGSRVPLTLKVLLTAIAIIDDLGAIIIIAFFYTADLSVESLWAGNLFVAGLILLNRFGVTRKAAYILLGIGLWICVLKSGVHATLAGVITALCIPMHGKGDKDPSLLVQLEHSLHPWVAFAILPLFAFANAGVSFEGVTLESFQEPVKLGISLGLFLGAQAGVFLMLFVGIGLKIAPMPPGTNWGQLYGVSLLTGIGFTMSLFIGSLAFEHTDFDAPIRLGVLTGSVAAAICGYVVLRLSSPSKTAT